MLKMTIWILLNIYASFVKMNTLPVLMVKLIILSIMSQYGKFCTLVCHIDKFNDYPI